MIDHIIKAIALQLQDGERVYVGLNSIPALIGAFMARDYYKKNIKILGVSEAFNPDKVEVSPSTGNPFFVEGSSILPTTESFDLVQKGKLDVMFLGPVQIDEETNVNISVIGSYDSPKVRLPGGAATAFILPLVKKAILWNLNHSRRSFVKKVDFVTGTAKFSGNKVIAVSNLCVLEFSRQDKRWYITYTYPWSTIEQIKQNTEFEVYPSIKGVVDINNDERKFIESIDPYELRLALEF